ncbi:MAG: hypothetical protein MN733_18065 [Nitrososphaera sp.]|nr:hypothetical protein [Nitrososphaera sp.]
MWNNKKVIAVIPARAGSKRIPYKNFILLKGVSLIERAIQFATGLDFLDDVIVTSDNPNVVKLCDYYRTTFRHRPKELSQGEPNSIANTWHDALMDKLYDVSILLEPSSPLREKSDIETCLQALNYGQTVLTVSVSENHKIYRPNGLCYAVRSDVNIYKGIYGDPTLLIRTNRPVVNIDTWIDLENAERLLNAKD